MAKEITKEMRAALDKPLPSWAVKPHPTKKDMSAINAIAVIERLNDVFGLNSWHTRSEFVEKSPHTAKNGTTTMMVVTKTTLTIPEYGIEHEIYGGNDNADLGDAYKGSVTDAITKIGSWLGIGAHVWKNDPNAGAREEQQQQTEVMRKAVVGYLTGDFKKSDSGREYYLAQFKHEEVGQFTEKEIQFIYAELKRGCLI